MVKARTRDLALFRWLILCGLAVLTVAFGTQIWLIARLRTAFESVHLRPTKYGQVPDYSTVMIVLAVAVAIGIVIVLAGFFLGMARARKMGEQAGLTGYKYNPAWTVASFFLPLFNLYRPWVGLGEIRRSIFVALETRQNGKKWNRFGDVSNATIALAIVIMGGIALEVAYNIFATERTPSGPLAAYAALHRARNQILITALMLIMQTGAFFAYLITLEGPLARLADLFEGRREESGTAG